MRLSSFAMLAGWAVAGCTGTVSSAGAPGDAEPATTTSAIVIVQRNADADGVHAEASARFVRVAASSSTQDALRAIGAAADLPLPGACGSIWSAASEGHPAEPAPVIELVDMGAIALEASGAETRLLPRQLPDITDVVSGTVYARAVDPTVFPASSRYVVHVGGKPEVAAFDVSAMAPADASDVRVVGEDDHGVGLATRDRAPSLMSLTWSAGDPTDLVYVDVQPAGVRCVIGDGVRDGQDRVRGTVPGTLFDDAGSLTVHRLHREPLHAAGMGTGEIRFDFARSMPYSRR